VHGFGEHSARFLDFAEYFVLNGYEVLMIDLRGFGYYRKSFLSLLHLKLIF
jgi:alpha-beta hydrolase superfamily lysophospholipase